MGSFLDPVRSRLARIKCLTEALECLVEGKSLPKPLCYVPNILTFEISDLQESIPILEEAKEDAKVLHELLEGETATVVGKGPPLCNSSGGWVNTISPCEGWLLIRPINTTSLRANVKILQSEKREPTDWLAAVEQMYTLYIGKPPQLINRDEEKMEKLSIPPRGWNLEADKDLVQYLTRSKLVSGRILGSELVHESKYFKSVQLSSGKSNINDLLDPNPNRFWESDGYRGTRHYMHFFMKPNVIVKTLGLLIDEEEENWWPRQVVLKGGTLDNMVKLSSQKFTSEDYKTKVLQLHVNPPFKYYEVIEVRIKSCFRGCINCRVHGVTITTPEGEPAFLPSEDLCQSAFTPELIADCPRLQFFQPEQLFSRALVLNRIIHLLNTDLMYLLPRYSHYSSTMVNTLCNVRQLLPLSSRRNVLIQDLLENTSCSNPRPPILDINRMAAREHAKNPSKDPECSMAFFNQLMSKLDKHRVFEEDYHFRWADKMRQWWECKFTLESMVDEGGGFKDLLADIAEELCPSDPNQEVPLSLFIRSPNQTQDSTNMFRDTYIPSPGCQLKSKYYFLGELMGAMFRSQESLVLPLCPFIWKKLVVEQVTWSQDFVSVDSSEVKFIDSIATISKKEFEESFEGLLTYATILSNGEIVTLVPDGEDKLVTYDTRLNYCEMVKERRMNECNVQIDAIREGFISVVPVEVLHLLSWQELELKVCKNPEVSVEALKKSTSYNASLSEISDRVQILWEAVEKFSNQDRSKFLRFISGRCRLPCSITIDKTYGSAKSSKLPTTNTCANILYLPLYSSVDEAVDRLKYAMYNCVSIDLTF